MRVWRRWQRRRLPRARPACLLARRPARRPAPSGWLPACLIHVLATCLPTSLHACQPACLPGCLPSGLAPCLPANLPSGLPVCRVTNQPACLPACLPAGTNWEAPMAGLMALLTILTSVPSKLEGEQVGLPLGACPPAMPCLPAPGWARSCRLCRRWRCAHLALLPIIVLLVSAIESSLQLTPSPSLLRACPASPPAAAAGAACHGGGAGARGGGGVGAAWRRHPPAAGLGEARWGCGGGRAPPGPAPAARDGGCGLPRRRSAGRASRRPPPPQSRLLLGTLRPTCPPSFLLPFSFVSPSFLLTFLLSSCRTFFLSSPGAGYNPLEAYGVGGLVPKLALALGRLVTACHQLYGFSRVTSMMK